MLQFLIIYCFFSYLFMLGVWSQADGIKRHMYLLAPITLPFIIGQVVITQHVFTAKKLLKIKREEDERARKEKEKAEAKAKAEERAQALAKKLTEDLEKGLRELMTRSNNGQATTPFPGSFAKRFNDMMNRNPWGW